MTEKEYKTAFKEAFSRLSEEEKAAYRKLERMRKQIEREEREFKKRHLLRVY